jgi:hypothetical protein
MRKRRVTHPYKYWKIKGRFGCQARTKKPRPYQVVLNKYLCIYLDKDFEHMNDCLNTVLKNPDFELDMRNVAGITIRGALILKAFFDEFETLHNKRPKLRGPRDEKMRTVLNYLKIGRYTDVRKRHYKDIDCWQIFDWDHTQIDIHFSKLLHDEIIPKCWPNNHAITEHSANIATSVAEALLNCKEHAYTGTKELSKIQKMVSWCWRISKNG